MGCDNKWTPGITILLCGSPREVPPGVPCRTPSTGKPASSVRRSCCSSFTWTGHSRRNRVACPRCDSHCVLFIKRSLSINISRMARRSGFPLPHTQMPRRELVRTNNRLRPGSSRMLFPGRAAKPWSGSQHGDRKWI